MKSGIYRIENVLKTMKEMGAIGFDELCLRLRDRLTMPLPGGKAHALYRAKPVGGLRPRFHHPWPPRPGGVIILLYEAGGSPRFPLIKRAEYDGTHSGQVSLPGGKAEPGENTVQAALRECEEEIGVPREEIEVLGKLTDFLVVASNFLVTPVIAFKRGTPVFKPDPIEVSRILEADVDSFAREHALREKEIIAGGKYRMIAPHFEIGEEVVWGATAMILNEFRIVLSDALL